jgi:hypothetical protein
MKTPPLLPALCLAASLSTTLSAASPSLTIYNQSFAVVRDTVPLDLKKGINEVSFDGATLRLEPDSVILRDSSGAPLQILEQNYRNDPVTQRLLLSLFEGKEIGGRRTHGVGRKTPGIVRSGPGTVSSSTSEDSKA